MKCNRCGYCCIGYAAMIVDDPALGPVEGNVVLKPSGVKCKHLVGDTPFEYSCAVHDKPWYPDTPCHEFTQVEPSPDTMCRQGEWFLSPTGAPLVSVLCKG